jgi:hypothetical protein
MVLSSRDLPRQPWFSQSPVAHYTFRRNL